MKQLPIKFHIFRWIFRITEKIFPYLAHRWAVKLFFTPMRFPEPEKEKELKTTGTPFYLNHGKKKIKGYHWGKGPVVLFVHGWSGRGAQFREFIEHVVSNGFKAVIFDGPAHGESDGKKTEIVEFSHVLRLLEAKFHGIYAIVAHSFGGPASLYAIKNGLKTNKLVMIASPTVGDDIIREFLSKINATEETGIYFKKYIKNKFNKDFDEYEALATSEHCLDLPMLLIHDANDKEVPLFHSEKLMEKLENSKLIKTQGLGHRRILKSKDVVDITVAFLNRKSETNSLRSDGQNKFTLIMDTAGDYFLL